jgi:membrane protease YdiL (CAAX protease family)
MTQNDNFEQDPGQTAGIPPAGELGDPSFPQRQEESVGDYELQPESPYSDQFPPALPPDRPLFQSYTQPEIRPPTRIPHLGHLCILFVLMLGGFLCSTVLILVALHYHLYGVTTLDQAKDEVHYNLGIEAIIYIISGGLSFLVFPLFWGKNFLAGIQWRGATALRLYGRLSATALSCFLLAMADGVLFKEAKNAPIDKLFATPGAAWLLFGFGVTFAPLFEEMIFRGFLLPALCTAWDWSVEHATHKPAPPLDANGHPQWSLVAMAVASILVSVPFAAMHAEQQGYALGPFVLLIGVSMVLCAVRLKTRSLAASVVVHSSYNFLLFAVMLIGTGGFKHLDKM